MIVRRARKRLGALFVVPFLMLTGTVGARTTFLCAMDHVERHACCCPQTHTSGSGEPSALTASCCCDLKTVTISATAPRDRSDGRVDCADGNAFTVAVAIASAPPPVRTPAALREHPPVGPPPLLHKQAFLL